MTETANVKRDEFWELPSKQNTVASVAGDRFARPPRQNSSTMILGLRYLWSLLFWSS